MKDTKGIEVYFSKINMAASLCVAALLTACGGGGGSSSSTTPTPVTVSPPPAPTFDGTITLEGTVSKGLFYGAEVGVISSADVESGAAEILARATTDPENGSFSLTLTTEDVRNYGDYLFLAVEINDLEMLCDSPTGCEDRAEFGETFFTEQASATTPELFLFSVVPTPDVNTTSNANINIFSTLHFNYMDAQISERDVVTIDSATVNAAAQRVATIFEFSDTNFHNYEYVDVTETVTHSNSEHIRASLISGGLQGATSKYSDIIPSPDRIGFEWGLYDFLRSFIVLDGELRANSDYVFEISLLDIYSEAKEFTNLDIAGNNALGTAEQSIEDSYQAIIASDLYAHTAGGLLVPSGPNEPPEFFNETSLIQFREGNMGDTPYPFDLNQTVFDPDGDVLTFAIDSGADADAFIITDETYLSPVTPFDCSRPDDADENHRYEVTVTYSDGEFSGTQDLDIRVYTDDGNFCPGSTSKMITDVTGSKFDRIETNNNKTNVRFVSQIIKQAM